VITGLPQHQIYWPYLPAKWALADIWMRTPISTSARLSQILGKGRVEAVEIAQASGQTELVACDTVVLTGDWIPQHELARAGGIALDPGTLGPRVDAQLRTSAPGVFAAGNLLRGVETADTAALEGRYVAGCIHDYLSRGNWPKDVVPIQVADPLMWVAPNAVAAGDRAAPLGHVLLRVKSFQRNAVVTIRQGERMLHTQQFGQLRPNTSVSMSGEWLKSVQEGGEPVRVSLGS
jgi:hypothetical protein